MIAQPARQLAFKLPHADNYSREDFLAGAANAAALAAIDRWPDWQGRVLVLVGPEASGKSHLAAIWAAEAGARCLSPAALERSELPQALATGALVIENADGASIDQRTLFHLLNIVHEEHAFLLMTAHTGPSAWQVDIPDLASRLRALAVVTLAAPDDALLRAVMVKHFADRQLAVDDSLISYLLSRIDRGFAAARDVVETLDREALRQKRPVTRTLAAELFREREGARSA
jgi:chromosomal replication initiation ATPase DnaA